MKALSFARPGAQAITDSTCRIINRHYEPGELTGQYIALHSSSQYSKQIADSMRAKGYNCPDELSAEQGIVGIAKIEYSTYESKSAWFEGPIGWKLSGVRVLRKPIQISGSLGAWDLPRHVVGMMKARWNETIPGYWESTEKTDMIGTPMPSILEVPVLAVNVQTTGIRRQDRIVSISMVEMFNGRITEELNAIVNPRCTIPTDSTRVHGITRQMAHRERSIHAHKNDINRMLNRVQYICGHDVYFSIKFLVKHLKCDLWNRHAIIIDTKKRFGKPLNKLIDKKYSDFVSKNIAISSYNVIKDRLGSNSIKGQDFGVSLDKALIWKGKKK